MTSDPLLLHVPHRVVTEVERAQGKAVDMGGGSDECVGDLDAVRAAERLTVASGFVTDAGVKIDAVDDAEKVADDELVVRSQPGVDFRHRHRCACQKVTRHITGSEPLYDTRVAPQPLNDDVAVEEILRHYGLGSTAPVASSGAILGRTMRWDRCPPDPPTLRPSGG
jgi:hypothetical protein